MQSTYAHVGYPKCASTALQTHFFAKHPELYHLGVFGGGTRPPYIDMDTSLAIEVDLRIAQDFMFDLHKMQELFARHYENFQQSGKKLMGIASESLTFHMHNELDVTQKANRLRSALGENTKIIMILRNQPDLIRSIYREWIISGLFFTFNDFWKVSLENAVRSPLPLLNFAKMYLLYAELFGQDNILVLPYEKLKSDSTGFIHALCDHLGISRACTHIGQTNTSMSDKQLELIRRLNIDHRHNLGRTIIEPVSAFRIADHFTKELGIPVPNNAMYDESILNYNIQFASQRSDAEVDAPMLDWSMQPWLQNRLNDFFADSNKNLQNMLGGRLNLAEYGYIGLA